MSDSNDYNVPRPTKIKLYARSPHLAQSTPLTPTCRKETKTEVAERIYRREQRHQAKLASRISRANGRSTSPVSARQGRDGSLSPPPRRRAAKSARREGRSDSDDDEIVEVHFDPLTGERTERKVSQRGERDRQRDPEGRSRSDGEGEWRSGGGERRRGGDATDGVFRRDPMREQEERTRYAPREAMNWADHFAPLHFPPQMAPPHIRIPSRYQHDSGFPSFDMPSGIFSHGWLGRNPLEEVRLSGGAVPDLGGMSETEYLRFIRHGMSAQRHRSDMDERRRWYDERERRDIEREAARAIREEQEQRERDREEHRRDREYRRARQRSAEAEMASSAGPRPAYAPRAKDERAKKERERYRARWAALVDTGGEIEMVDLSFKDIPWPVYAPVSGQDITILDLEVDRVQTFLYALAADTTSGSDGDAMRTARKNVLREAIKAFHPDRFFGRILPRVREADRELVKEGVERCSRLINELIGKL